MYLLISSCSVVCWLQWTQIPFLLWFCNSLLWTKAMSPSRHCCNEVAVTVDEWNCFFSGNSGYFCSALSYRGRHNQGSLLQSYQPLTCLYLLNSCILTNLSVGLPLTPPFTPHLGENIYSRCPKSLLILLKPGHGILAFPFHKSLSLLTHSSLFSIFSGWIPSPALYRSSK